MAHAQKDENRYRMLFENMTSGFALFDVISDEYGKVQNLFYIDQNTTHENQTGLQREQFSGKTIIDVFPMIDIDIVSNMGNAAINGNTYSKEFFSRDFGKFIRVSAYSPDKNKIAVIFDDITEMKHAEQNFRKFLHGIEQSPFSVVITDTWGNIEYVNPKFCSVTGYTKEEVTGQNQRILKSGETKIESYTEMWDTLASGNEWRGEFLNKKKNGELYWETVNISSVNNENGSVTHYIGIKEDITEKKRAAKQLKTAMDKAAKISSFKSDFLADISHELLNPMVAILGYSEILGREITDTSQKDMINSISGSGKRIMEILNLILDFSQIESKKYELNLKPLNLFKHAAESVRLFTPLATSKNIEMNVSASEGGIVSMLDEKLFRSIIDNLLNNAVKYTLRGRIDVLINRQKSKTGELSVLHVKDTGIGIAKEHIGTIFEEFRPAGEGLDRPYHGLGLRLTVTKKFVELLNGTIGVQSIPGKGSTFTVRFPALIDSEHNTEIPESQNLTDSEVEKTQSYTDVSAKKALVVDDDESTHYMIKGFLRGICTINSVFSGEEALMLAGMTQYDIVLLDISLGKGLNGYEVLKEIRKIKGYSDIPVIALTAYAMSGDEDKFLRAGFTHYISKPFDHHDLRTAIKNILA